MDDPRLDVRRPGRLTRRRREDAEFAKRRGERHARSFPVRADRRDAEHAVARVRLVLDPEVRVATEDRHVSPIRGDDVYVRHAVCGDAERELAARARMPVLESEVAVDDHDRRGRVRDR